MSDNFRAALAWTIETSQTEPALHLAGHLGWFWFIRTGNKDGLQWLKQAAELPEARHYPRIYVEVLCQLVYHTWLQFGADPALPVAEHAVAAAQACADPWCLAIALNSRSHLQLHFKQFGQSSP